MFIVLLIQNQLKMFNNMIILINLIYVLIMNAIKEKFKKIKSEIS